MKPNMFDRESFVSQLKIKPQDLDTWEKKGLISPVGVTEDQTPIYSAATARQVEQIQKLNDLGYAPDAIRKIIKQVGLPATGQPGKSKSSISNYLTVGGLAEKAGLSPRTLKHWETIGIIEPDMRSEGGFRLFSESYIFLCQLVQDLQHFGYSLEEIKKISDYFRDFLLLQKEPGKTSRSVTAQKLNEMLEAIEALFGRINQLKAGIQRWEDLLKKKRKEIQNLRSRNQKREKE